MTRDVEKPDGWDGELEDVVGDVDPSDPEAVSDILEGLLGPDSAERADVQAAAEQRAEEQTAASEANPDGLDAGPDGRWTCRFCQRTYRDKSPGYHHEWCQSTADWERRRQRRQTDGQQALADDGTDSDTEPPDVGGDSPAAQQRYLVAPGWHEFRAYLKFQRHGLDPYYALHSLMRRTDWSDGKREFTIEYDGVSYTGEFYYQYDPDTALAPWDDASFQIEKVREYRITLRGPDDLRKASFHIRPRWPDMETENGKSPSNPRDMVGLDVDTKGSNHDPSAYPQLLDRALQALGVNGGSDDPEQRYCTPATLEPWSIVVDGELYVRIYTDHSGPLVAIQGPLERMGLLLADERRGYRKRVADDTKTEGYYHTTTLGSWRAGHLLDGHRLGKEVKHYHVKHPESVDGPLKHPKFGVAFQRSRSDARVYWDIGALETDPLADDEAIGLDDLERELDEVLLNCLRWADLPTRPDHQVFVDDPVWAVAADRRERRLVPDPLPTLESEQEHYVTRALRNMTDTDGQIVHELLTDGGHVSPKDLADRTGAHYHTVLESLKRMGGVVRHEYGSVELKSKFIAQQLVERAGSLLANFTREMDAIGDQLAYAIDGLEREDSVFARWAETYLTGIDDLDDDPRIVLRFGYRPADVQEAKEILADGVRALRTTLGVSVADDSRLMRWGRPEMTLQDGRRLAAQGRDLKQLAGIG